MSAVERGPGWEMHLGDCLAVMVGLEKVDATITDPPYGIDLGKCGDVRGKNHGLAHDGYDGYNDSYEAFVASVVPRIGVAIDAAKRALVWTGPHIHEQRKPAAIGGVYAPAGSGRTPWGFKSFLPALLYGSSPTVARGKGATVPTVLVSTSSSDRNVVDHPVPKPLDWMLWSVRLASDPGETVLDPFAGSGTTGVACLRLGRRFIGIEKAPRYFALACERLRAEEQGLTLQAARAGQLALIGGVK